MIYEFTKIHGAGNDFIFIEDMEDKVTLCAEQVSKLCNRHFGIGADGVILVKPVVAAKKVMEQMHEKHLQFNFETESKNCDAFMYYINSDGTLAQMCGNGVRCFAKYIVDKQIVDKAKGYVDVWTLAGAKHIDYKLDSDGLLELATVNMGKPILDAKEVPTNLQPNSDSSVIDIKIQTPYGELTATCVSMGNPHCVCFMDNGDFFEDPTSFDIQKIGSYMECNQIFPQKCNIEFVYVVPDSKDSTILMRVWERGCGETLACGTGACATGVAAYISGRSGRTNDVKLLGGTLNILYNQDGNVIMTGPAKEVYTGKVDI